MALRRTMSRVFFLLAAVTLGLVVSQTASAQVAAAGVEVDAEGVLRTRVFHDSTGQLMKRRLMEARAALDRDIAKPSELRKISLNRLEAALAERIKENAGVPSDMKYLAGLTSIQYVFFYPETGDIVIAGPAEGYVHDLSGRVVGMNSGKSVLELEDLVVALRAFAPGKPGTKTIGCSIDPTKEGLAKMREYLVRVSGRVTPQDAAPLAAGLKENLGLQTVTVKGVSPKTHFAQVLVEADYRMKLIGIGLEQPPVKITSYVDRASPAAVSRNALQRWYFTPNYDSVKVSEDQLAMELVGQGVKLVGADELVTAEGTRVRSTVVDKASQQFTESFTRNYEKLAIKSPVYAQMKNLIDMAIAAAFIQQQDYYGKADWKMEVFGNEELMPVEMHNAPAQVETAVNAIWKGNTLMTPVGGGVSIQVSQALSPSHLIHDEGEVAESHKQIDIKAVPVDRWWWD